MRKLICVLLSLVMLVGLVAPAGARVGSLEVSEQNVETMTNNTSITMMMRGILILF